MNFSMLKRFLRPSVEENNKILIYLFESTEIHNLQLLEHWIISKLISGSFKEFLK